MKCFMVDPAGKEHIRDFSSESLRTLLDTIVDLNRRHANGLSRMDGHPDTLRYFEHKGSTSYNFDREWLFVFDSALQAQMFLIEFQRRKDGAQ